MPSSDPDALRAAALVIAQHGDDAEMHAVTRADELLAAGDLAGEWAWRRILAAIDELRTGRRPDQPLH